MPQLCAPQAFSSLLENSDHELKLLLQPGAKSLEQNHSAPQRLLLLVGPEGGWTGAEIELAQRMDCQLWGLGERVLRTETAPLAGLSILQHLWGDLA